MVCCVGTEYLRTTGLGNKLFAWSRAIVAAHTMGVKLMPEFWFSPKNAAITRGGIDYKTILRKTWLLDNFIADPNSKLINLSAKILRKKFYFSNLYDFVNYVSYNELDDICILFSATSDHTFTDLYPFRRFIAERLKMISIVSDLNLPKKYLSVNYRSGNDFVSSRLESSQAKTSIKWYVESIEKIFSIYGSMPIVLVTDGKANDIAPLFKHFGELHVANNKRAIEDLYAVMGSSVILGAGNSSFSAWASFLSGVPTYSSASTPFDKWNLPKLNQLVEVI